MSNTPVTFTGADAALRHNAAICALRRQGYSRVMHVSDATGCISAWVQAATGETVELECLVQDHPLVAGFARMEAAV